MARLFRQKNRIGIGAAVQHLDLKQEILLMIRIFVILLPPIFPLPENMSLSAGQNK